jgi:hypothetical protein
MFGWQRTQFLWCDLFPMPASTPITGEAMPKSATELSMSRPKELDSLPPGFSAHTPEISTEYVPRCPVCGSANRNHFARGYDYELQTCRNEWNFWRCVECETVWLDPRPAAAELGVIYPRTYYAYNRSEKVSPFARKGKEILDRIKFSGFLKRTGARDLGNSRKDITRH